MMTHLLAVLAVSLAGQGAAETTPPGPLEALEAALTRTIAATEPSVVSIVRARNPEDPRTTAVRGRDADERPGAFAIDGMDLSSPDYLPMPGDFGSGVVIGPRGEILTAFHVVKGASRLFVRAPGRQAFDAEVIAADPRSDLAVIVPRAGPGLPVPKLTPIKLGEAELLRKGAFLVSLGNPFHAARDGNASASWGILSNTARRIIPPREDALEARQLFRHQPTLLQLDTKLSLGMSGGAVVNLKGELVGITTTGGNVEGFDAMAGYAVPMDALGRRVVGALIEGREAEYGFLGIRLDERAPNLVGGVEPGTPAAEGDLVVGDLVRSVNGRPVSEETGLSLALSTAPVGEPVRLEVDRDGKVLVKTVFLSKYPINGEVIATNRPSSWRGLRVDFTSVLARSTFNDAVLQAMAKGCVSVVEVQAGSPAETAGLRRGQVITRVGEKAVRTPTEFAEVVAALKGPVELQTDRGAVTIK